MKSDFPDVFDLFARNPAATVASLPAYEALRTKYLKFPQFELQTKILQRVKQALELALDQQLTLKDQARRAIALMEQNRALADFEWYFDFIDAVYGPQWPETERGLFDRAVRYLRKTISDFPELIDLYANYPVADIAGLPSHIELCRHYQGNRQFEKQRCKTEKLKNQLEGAIGDAGTYQEQIRAALKLLEASRESADFDWYYALIVAGYKRHWRDDQKEYFDWAASTIRAGNDFFLSFTSRPHDETSVQKPVNRRYWHFIRSVIRVETYPPEEQRDRNLLAEAVYKLLKENSLRGFYSKMHERNNLQVKAKLIDGCATSRVFLQLVQNVMFDAIPDTQLNFCEFEFNKAYELIGAGNPENDYRLLFVLAEDKAGFVQPGRVTTRFKVWHNHIVEKDPPDLPRVDSGEDANLNQIRDTIEKTIVPQIKCAWDKVLDRVP